MLTKEASHKTVDMSLGASNCSRTNDCKFSYCKTEFKGHSSNARETCSKVNRVLYCMIAISL